MRDFGQPAVLQPARTGVSIPWRGLGNAGPPLRFSTGFTATRQSLCFNPLAGIKECGTGHLPGMDGMLAGDVSIPLRGLGIAGHDGFSEWLDYAAPSFQSPGED